MQTASKPNVIGGGFGGLEAAFYFRMKLGDGADITLVSARGGGVGMGLEGSWLV